MCRFYFSGFPTLVNLFQEFSKIKIFHIGAEMISLTISRKSFSILVYFENDLSHFSGKNVNHLLVSDLSLHIFLLLCFISL